MERRPQHSHLRQTDLGQVSSLLPLEIPVSWSGRAGEAMLTSDLFLPPEENPCSPLSGVPCLGLVSVFNASQGAKVQQGYASGHGR